MRLAIAVILFSMAVTNVFAKDMTLSNFIATRDMPHTMGYINGLGMAYTYSNAWLQVSGLPMMYCQPAGVALFGENYAQLVDEEVKRPSNAQKYAKDDAVGAILLKSLIAQFPCIGGLSSQNPFPR